MQTMIRELLRYDHKEKGGATLADVRDMLGHKHISTTILYLGSLTSNLQSLVGKMNFHSNTEAQPSTADPQPPPKKPTLDNRTKPPASGRKKPGWRRRI